MSPSCLHNMFKNENHPFRSKLRSALASFKETVDGQHGKLVQAPLEDVQIRLRIAHSASRSYHRQLRSWSPRISHPNALAAFHLARIRQEVDQMNSAWRRGSTELTLSSLPRITWKRQIWPDDLVL